MTVYVVEADPAVRGWLEEVLESTGLTVTAMASASEFLACQPAPDPACIVADMLLPDMTGLDLLRRLQDRGVTLPIVFVSAHADVPTAVKAMKAGAVDFLEKPLRAQEVLAAVQAALARPEGRRMAQGSSAEIQGLMARLTPREREVLGLIMAGLSNKEMARKLGLSPKTIEAHRAKLYTKMRADSLADLVRKGIEGGG
ncbi:MAG: response regulator transcription factor [Thiobacillaceae bacterium]